MANEIKWTHTDTGVFLYTKFTNIATRQIWSTVAAALVDFAVADIANYDNAMPESPAGSYRYLGTVPALPAGDYDVEICLMDGAVPAITDTLLAGAFLRWSGTEELFDALDATVAKDATLLALGDLPQTAHVFTAGEKITIPRLDKYDLPFALGVAHDCTGKKLYFAMKATLDATAYIISPTLCVLTDELNVIGTVPLTPALLPLAKSGVYEYKRRDADGVSNPHTIVQGQCVIAEVVIT